MKRTFFLSILMCILPRLLYAQIAVFPFEDLSKDLNGVNLKISRIIAHRLKEQGFSVVGPDEVVDFLSRHHVMWTGWVDRVTADRVKRELGAQYILLGSVLEYDPVGFRFGLVMRMVDADRYRLVWADKVFFSNEDRITFLGLGEKNWDFFLSSAVEKVLSRMPQEVLRVLAKIPVLDVARVSVMPRYAGPGDKVVCRAKVEVSGAEPEEVFFVIDKVGRVLARREGDFYTASWIAPSEEGRFGVALEARWDGSFNIKKRLFVTTYYVDKTPPVFSMKFFGVKKLKNMPVMNGYVKIVPFFKKKEPIKRWLLKVIYKGEEQKTVLFYSSMGDIPPWLIWRGKSSSGALENGRYEIELTLWDRADNSYTARREIIMVKGIDTLNVKAYKEEKGIRFSISLGNYPLSLSDWRLVLWSEDGAVFYEKEGEGMPQEVFFHVKYDEQRKFYYTLELVDEAGNRWKIKRKLLVITKAKKEKKKESGWVDDF